MLICILGVRFCTLSLSLPLLLFSFSFTTPITTISYARTIMDFLRRLTHSVLDGISTPPAPKIGRIPLPDVDSMHDVKDIVVQLEGHRSASDDCSSGCSSPVSPITQKRKWSFSASRSSTPQTRCTSRTSSSSYPHPASTLATPHIVAPTPRRVGEMLREDGWRRCESPAQDEQTEVASQHTDRAKRTSSNPVKPSRTVTPHSPSVDLVHSPQGAARPRSNSTRDERHAHRELDHRRHHGPVVSRPSTATPSAGHLSERALPLERSGTPGHTTKRPPKGILKSSTSTSLCPRCFTVSLTFKTRLSTKAYPNRTCLSPLAAITI